MILFAESWTRSEIMEFWFGIISIILAFILSLALPIILNNNSKKSEKQLNDILKSINDILDNVDANITLLAKNSVRTFEDFLEQSQGIDDNVLNADSIIEEKESLYLKKIEKIKLENQNFKKKKFWAKE